MEPGVGLRSPPVGYGRAELLNSRSLGQTGAFAADGFVASAGTPIVGELKRLASGSKPEQRVQALRLLHQRGLRLKEVELVEFARSTAAADKAPSAQALIAEWEAGAAADAAPEARYEIAVPVIAWHEQPDARVSPLLRKLWQDMNVLIREDNQKAHEHYERWRKEHGTPQWKLRRTAELPSEWLAGLDSRLASGVPTGADDHRRRQGSPCRGCAPWRAMPRSSRRTCSRCCTTQVICIKPATAADRIV